MGFGHRVYRAEDPRARVLRATAKRLEAPRYEVAAALEQAALTELRERRPDRAIETNVEFWAAVILDFAEVPAKMMPAMFTCGRTAGWCAHILEQKRLGKLVRPSAIYVGPGPRSPESVEGWDEIARAVADPTAAFASAARSFRRPGASNPRVRVGRAGSGRLGSSGARRTRVALADHREQLSADRRPNARTSRPPQDVLRADRATTRRSRRRRRSSSAAGRPAAISAAIPPPRSTRLVERVLAERGQPPSDPLIAVIGGLGIRLHTYLPTRTFELAVHGLDIARATGLSFTLPADVLDEATVLAARIAVATGDGEIVLTALTGRAALPPSFSVVYAMNS